MAQGKRHSNVNELIELYFLRSISDEQKTELVAVLENSKSARDRFRQAARIDAELRHLSNRDESHSVARSTVRPTTMILAALAASVLLIGSVTWFARGAPDQVSVSMSAELSVVSGDVFIVGQDGVRRSGGVGDSIQPQDTLQVSGEDAFAGVTFSDKTSVTLVRHAAATFGYDAGKHVTVHSGKLVANVSPQPEGHPMILTTSQVRVDVLGTRFAVAADDSKTDIAVQSGQVRVTRADGPESIVVDNGKRVQSGTSDEMILTKTQPTPNTWSMSFELGVPEGWLGTPVTDELPSGSSCAAKAEFNPVFSNHAVQAPEDWTLGLFTVETNTHLHVTFKMSNPDWINFFSQVRASNFETSNLMLCNSAPFDHAKPDTWYTMTIPVQEWRRKQKGATEFSDGQPPVAGEVFYGLALSSVGDDRGLVVDRIWVTTDGPGTITMEPVE